MTYPALSLAFLSAAIVGGALVTVATRPSPARSSRGALVLAAVALIALTAVFDNVMIALGLFHYAPEPLGGVLVGSAPLEDFAYPLACVALLPALWSLLRRRARAPHRAIPASDDPGGRA